MELINEEMRKKKEGLTLGEKIAEKLEEVKANGQVKIIDNAFFKEEKERGATFFVRRGDFMAEGRVHNVIDEVEEEEKQQKAFEETEAKRD